MKNTFAIGLCAALMMTPACSRIADMRDMLPSFGDKTPEVDPTDPCGAQGYTGLLGSSLAAVTLPADLNDRVLRPGDAATTDYDPSRLNIELDETDTIIGLSCG